MADEKKRVAYWSDTRSNLLVEPVIRFGDSVTDILTEERKEYLAKRGKVTFEPVEEEEKADLAKTKALEKTLASAEKRIKDLEKDLSGVPKNVTAARKEIKDLKSQIVEKDIEIEDLTEPKKGGK
jgi:predicted  nucleic acid-binding Zn-ribbon protein